MLVLSALLGLGQHISYTDFVSFKFFNYNIPLVFIFQCALGNAVEYVLCTLGIAL
jgi:hypothetical protein